MSYDGIAVRAVVSELKGLLTGARLDKIYQPSKNEILLHLRNNRQNFRLLLSTLAQEAAVYCTNQIRENPIQAPLFCMVLRKHLEGARVISVEQPGLERIIEFTLEAYNELSDLVHRRLIAEIMGKHSNIILIDPATQKIIDSLHRIPQSISSYRQVLPGLTYIQPPPQEKVIPWEITEEEFKTRLLAQPLSQKLAKCYLNLFGGFGPQTCAELISRAGLDPSQPLEFCGDYELTRLWETFNEAVQAMKEGSFQPEVIMQEGRPITFSAIALTGFTDADRLSFPSLNEALDYFYSHRLKDNSFQQKKGNLSQIISKEIERCEKKAGLQAETIHAAEETEHCRLWGELLTANQYQLSPGKEARVQNYYDPDCQTITIPLDENLSVMENAQNFFKKYQKARNAAKQAQIQLEETRRELDYLQSLITSLENVTTMAELEEISLELQEAGYLKATASRQKKTAPAVESSKPVKVTIANWEIYYGKNNKQNDLLTMKMAKAEDTWLHAKDIPGSHVIIKNPEHKEIPEEILEAAAILAAYNSKARFSTQVPVDYTLKKHVWKIKGAKPGMVNYDNQRTVYVTPTEEKIKEIQGECTNGSA